MIGWNAIEKLKSKASPLRQPSQRGDKSDIVNSKSQDSVTLQRDGETNVMVSRLMSCASTLNLDPSAYFRHADAITHSLDPSQNLVRVGFRQAGFGGDAEFQLSIK
jgi:hypothetical protein